MTDSIFQNSRCPNCNQLILRSENHACSKKIPRTKTSNEFEQKLYDAFKNLDEVSLKPSEICHYLNHQEKRQIYTHFEIEYYFRKHPKKFAVDEDRKYKSKYKERYYVCL